jgi:hypothetical protein
MLSAAGGATSAICAPTLFRRAIADRVPVEHLDYLVPTTDAKFGSKVIKVTNPNGEVPGLGLTWDHVAIHHYSIDQAWNADQTLLALDRGTKPKLFLDGRTYRPLMALSRPGDVRWHPRLPDEMIFVSSSAIGRWNVRADKVSVVQALTDYGEASFGDHKGNPSDDGKMIAVTATRSDGARVVFAYDLDTRRKYPDIDMSSERAVEHTTISSTGSHVIVYSRATWDRRSKQRRIFTVTGELRQSWTEYERPGHGDFAIDLNGDEVFIGRSKSLPEQWQIIARRLVDGKVSVLSPPCLATHVSKRNLRDRDWFFATFAAKEPRSDFAPYSGEVAAMSMDGTQAVRRLAQTRAVESGYLTEPHACPSPDGRRVIFASNWGVRFGPIAAYVAEFA